MRSSTVQVLDKVEQLKKADRVPRSATDVESLTGEPVGVVHRRQHRIDEVLDVQDVPNLLAVAIDRKRMLLRGTDEKVRYPALVFGAELMRTVDTTHPKDDVRQIV